MEVWGRTPSQNMQLRIAAKPSVLCCHLANTNQEQFHLLPNLLVSCLITYISVNQAINQNVYSHYVANEVIMLRTNQRHKNAQLHVLVCVSVCRVLAVCSFRQRKSPSFKQPTSREYLVLMSAFQLQAKVSMLTLIILVVLITGHSQFSAFVAHVLTLCGENENFLIFHLAHTGLTSWIFGLSMDYHCLQFFISVFFLL